jgi:hypothetical protein
MNARGWALVAQSFTEDAIGNTRVPLDALVSKEEA